MRISWRQVSALLVLLALVAAACSSDPSDVVVGDDSAESIGDAETDAADEGDDAGSDFDDAPIADDSAPEEVVIDLEFEVELMLERNALARELWQAAGIEDYDLTLVTDLQAAVFDVVVAPRYELEVRGGVLTRTLPDDSFSGGLDEYLFSETLFDQMEEELASGTEPGIYVEFDDRTGWLSTIGQLFPSGDVVEARYRNFRTLDEYPEECSTAGPVSEAISNDLDESVRETRDEILRAAAECDFLALSAVAGKGNGFVETSFGGSGVELIWKAESSDEPLMSTLVELLVEEPAITESGTAVWPASFLEPDNESLDWRVGINDEGEWLFYIAGD